MLSSSAYEFPTSIGLVSAMALWNIFWQVLRVWGMNLTPSQKKVGVKFYILSLHGFHSRSVAMFLCIHNTKQESSSTCQASHVYSSSGFPEPEQRYSEAPTMGGHLLYQALLSDKEGNQRWESADEGRSPEIRAYANCRFDQFGPLSASLPLDYHWWGGSPLQL